MHVKENKYENNNENNKENNNNNNKICGRDPGSSDSRPVVFNFNYATLNSPLSTPIKKKIEKNLRDQLGI